VTRRPRAARALLLGAVAFLATSAAMVLGAGMLTPWNAPAPLDPLRPAPAEELTRRPALRIESSSVTFGSGRSIDGILTAPVGGAEVGVVLVAGAGEADRRLLLPVAEELARSGVAAFTYDKRVDGYSVFHRDIDGLADDALLAVTALRETSGASRVGTVGVSEGGWVVSAATGRGTEPVDFVVLASAPVVSPLEQAGWVVDGAISGAPAVIRRSAAATVGGGRFVTDGLDIDPLEGLATAGVPVLALWGAEDDTVPVNEAYRRLRSALTADLRAHVISGAGHDLVAESVDWVPLAAEWARSPRGSAVTGAEPASALGVVPLTRSPWYIDPRLHLALSLTVAVLTVGVRRRVAHISERTGR
jgi:alpha-beta hydrolase superfamily lysophospholipase